MKMNLKTTSKKLKMRGFMCQTPTATAVCMTSDSGSVIVPRKPDKTSNMLDNTRLINNKAKYTRLNVESHRFTHKGGGDQNPIFLPSINKEKDNLRPNPTANSLQIKQQPSQDSQNQVFQVVVMRVSLHCQGCAGRVQKHLSKMEGVTSFSIELETKRVTVMGHVSPAGVLESISKVRRAEFWPCN